MLQPDFSTTELNVCTVKKIRTHFLRSVLVYIPTATSSALSPRRVVRRHTAGTAPRHRTHAYHAMRAFIHAVLQNLDGEKNNLLIYEGRPQGIFDSELCWHTFLW